MLGHIKRIRQLTFLLAISGGLNIILGFFIFYWMTKENPPTPYFELKPAKKQELQTPLAIDHSNSEIIRHFRRMPLQWLISRLSHTQLVENGYTERDLALASLTSFHSFDLERAFTGLPSPEKRTIVYGQFQDGRPAELTVFPNLSNKHFAAVQHFASTERWPLTSKGLFLALQKGELDPHLLDAFFMTQEFNTIEMIFNRNQVPVSKEELLKVILEGNWVLFSAFVEQQKTANDLSAARRQHFLLQYIQHQSKAAAQLLLKTDPDFATRKLDDAQILVLLKLLDEKNVGSETFALAQLTSPRSDAVRKQAAERLYQYEGAILPEPYKHQEALARFVPEYKMLSESSSRNISIRNETKTTLAKTGPTKVEALKPEVTKNEAIKSEMVKTELKTNPLTSKSQSLSKTKPIKTNTSIKSDIASNSATPTASQPSKPISKSIASQTLSLPSSPSKLNKAQRTLNQKRDFYYTVQEGDSLWQISRRFNVDIEVLRAFNQLNTDALHPGQKLRVPQN
jgi:LysM repeat protein